MEHRVCGQPAVSGGHFPARFRGRARTVISSSGSGRRKTSQIDCGRGRVARPVRRVHREVQTGWEVFVSVGLPVVQLRAARRRFRGSAWL